MLDIKFIRENPELVKKNMEKKFQHHKLNLVDDVISLDMQIRELKLQGDTLRAERNTSSQKIGQLMREKNIEEANKIKNRAVEINQLLVDIEAKEAKLTEQLKNKMMVIPNIIDPRKVAGNGFYYLLGDIARLHEGVIAYARDFMIDKGFTYCIPPFMIRSNVVTGVMSFDEMDQMMYKIEGEDLYLIGTSEHSMIGRFIDTIHEKNKLPYTLTSYSPCFRKEKGAHGIEERGIYRIHQFEKQEMIVVCEPEDSKEWFDKLWHYTVDLFTSMKIPVRALECCSGDLADLKVKSIDIEAWSPRQKKYFEVGSCSNLGDAQARRLAIRIKGENGNYFAHTLNNTVVAPPRMLIAILENFLQEDGSVLVPEVLWPYMGGTKVLKPKK